jgi:hypothetical protein
VGDPRSKYHRHTYFAANLNDDPKTEDNPGILNENNELVELHAVSVKKDIQIFERTARAMFPDPTIFVASNKRRP